MTATSMRPFSAILAEWQAVTGLTDDAAATQFDITVSTFRDWKNGGKPGLNLEGQIREVTGYNFNDWRYQETHASVIEQNPTIGQDAFVQEATTQDAFKIVLARCAADLSPEAIIDALGLRRTQVGSIRGFLNGDHAMLRRPVLDIIIKGLPTLRRLVSGEVLDTWSPPRFLIQKAETLMHELGLSAYALSMRIKMTDDALKKLFSQKHEQRIAMQRATRDKLVSFIRDATEELEKRRQQKPQPPRWPQFLRTLQEFTRNQTHSVSDIAEAIGASEERVRRWLRGDGHPTGDELNRIEAWLGAEQQGASAPAVPPVSPTAAPTSVSQPLVAAAPKTTEQQSGRPTSAHEFERLMTELRFLSDRLRPLLAIVAPPNDEYIAGGVPPGDKPGLRFTLTRESFRPLIGAALTPEETADTAALITEIRRRINIIVEARDVEAKRGLHDQMTELYVSLLAFDSVDPTLLFDILETNRSMLGSPRGARNTPHS
ncbi:hypothetical protein HY478_00840 [Candidatus Uhrbacteria bacterium]|nr:hypothetical protein [Candidatus Uhrbacteria bacterium]